MVLLVAYLPVCQSACVPGMPVCMSDCLPTSLPVFCLPESLSVCLSTCLSVCLFVSLFTCLSVYVTVCRLSVCQSVNLSVCRFVSLPIYFSICQSASLSVGLSICLSVCLSVSLSFFVYLSVRPFKNTKIMSNCPLTGNLRTLKRPKTKRKFRHFYKLDRLRAMRENVYHVKRSSLQIRISGSVDPINFQGPML